MFAALRRPRTVWRTKLVMTAVRSGFREPVPERAETAAALRVGSQH